MTGRKAALLFPGQASQFVGMGKALADTYSEAQASLDRAERVVDFDLMDLIFQGPESTLARTEYQQPAVLAVSLAAFAVLKSQLNINPVCAAGHSLGEYAALAAAGSIAPETAVELVRQRGQIMAEAVGEIQGGMLVLIGKGPIDAAGLCDAVSQDDDACWPANFNSPGQVVISGALSALDRAKDRAREFGARMAKPLPVSAPFHCPLMQPATARFAKVLEAVEILPPAFPVYSNVTGSLHPEDPAIIRDLLIRQIESPVRFTEIGGHMAENFGGVLRIECGPGNVLTGLYQRMDTQNKVLPFGLPDQLAPILQEFDNE